MNAGSGSEDADVWREAIRRELEHAGRDFEIVVAPEPGALSPLAQAAALRRPGVLVAAGGDGTLNAVGAVAWESGLPLAVIPSGTFNYFARALGIPLDPEAATRWAITGKLRLIPVGRINGRIFLNNASIGLYRRLIEQREVHKQRYGRNRGVALLSALTMFLRPAEARLLSLNIDGHAEKLLTPSVFFGRNPLQMAQLGLDEAESVAHGEMAVLAPRSIGRAGMLALMLRGALGKLETAPDLRQYCARRVIVDWPRRKPSRLQKIRVAIDGEVIDCHLPLVVEVPARPLQVIAPPPGSTTR